MSFGRQFYGGKEVLKPNTSEAIKTIKMHSYIQPFYLVIILIVPDYLLASSACNPWVAKVISSQGKVDFQKSEYSEWQAISEGDIFCYGDKVRTAENSRATLMLRNETTVSLDQSTTLIFIQPEEKTSNWWLNIIEGSTFFRSRQPQRLNIQTPFINAVHEGTEFLVSVNSQATKISVFDGQVAAENPSGRIQIKQGFVGIAQKDQPPQIQPLTIRPEDAVQWTLYYPAIIDYQELKRSDISATLKKSIDGYFQGDIYTSLANLDEIPLAQQDLRYLAVKASLFLIVGRVDEANQNIDAILQVEPENSHAFALKAIIAVTKNQQDAALDLALKAVKFDAESSVAHIALSYAYQSRFKIELALKAAQEATRLAPDNALAWARLSELQLSSADRAGSLAAAKKAETLNPELARTQTILGFASLAALNINDAKKAFERAIHFDSADPLARLGLGLAKIRKGAIEEGARELEIAVTLDPNNAVMRSYLGKAYYELKNTDFAGTELAIAKTMDPKDPTPWFYDAILKQTTNRPIEALQDMQKAIELNDNRGVYRSRMLLDEDSAARTANQARIYSDLGFGRVALRRAWESLGYDSTNFSAHRNLADSYFGQPRFRIARASELLQAQLLQPINITPVQPQLSNENIGILNSTGPSSISVNEYDPMFTSNGAHVMFNGAVGSNNTITDNAVISGVYDQLSMSLGQFHFQTDGFRVNDDYKQDIYDAFVQYQVNRDLSIQLELKSEDVRAGDVPFRLNGFHQEKLEKTIEQDSIRFGGHYRVDSTQDLLFSFIYTSLKDIETDTTNVFFTTVESETLNQTDNSGYQTELQYYYHPGDFKIIAGFGYLDLSSKEINKEDIFFVPSRINLCDSGFPCDNSRLSSNITYANSYVYSEYKLMPNFTTIFGLSYDLYDDSMRQKIDKFNPKLGVLWSPFKNLTLRGAVFRTLKRPLTTNQTIEPTQIAGFNQFFDGNDGTTSWNYGFGVDYQPFRSVYLGGEITFRESVQPVEDFVQDRYESSHIAYFYWAPLEWLSFKSEYRFERFSRDFSLNKIDNTNPRGVETQQVPFSFNFYHPNGFFSKLSGNFVNQQVESVANNSNLDTENESFWIFDTTVGYRLPKKLGTVGFEVHNLFNNNFNYQSTFDASGPQLTPFVPERQFFLKLSLFY